MELIRQSKRDEIFKGIYTETSIVLYDSGILEGKVHTWTRNKFQGAHAQASVVLLDAGHRILWTMAPVRCGVAGRWDPSGSSDRTLPFSIQVPIEVLPNVMYLALINNYRDESAFLDLLKKYQDNLPEVGIYILKKLATS